MVIGQVRKAEQKISFYQSLLRQETQTVQLAETAAYYYCSTQPKISGPTGVLNIRRVLCVLMSFLLQFQFIYHSFDPLTCWI
jgi:hypothetical protein